MSVSEALEGGDRAEQLRAILRVLAGQLDSPPTTKDGGEVLVASVAKQYRETLAELAALEPAEVSTSDDLASRRRLRRAAVQDGTGTG